MNPMKTGRDDMAGLVHHNERSQDLIVARSAADARSPARGNRAGKGLEAVKSGSPLVKSPTRQIL